MSKPSLSSMLCFLPPGMLDPTIDHLHNDLDMFKICCTFLSHSFHSSKGTPSPMSNLTPQNPMLNCGRRPFGILQLSHLPNTYSLHSWHSVTATDCWICTFHNVECSWLSHLSQASLILFYRLSPATRSLCLTYGPFKVFYLDVTQIH